MSALLNLENKWGTRDVWNIQARQRNGAVPTTFNGTETLTFKVSVSQGAPAIFSTIVSWSNYTTGLVAVELTAANSALLSAGEVYQGEVYSSLAGGEPVCILWFTLTSLPSAGSGGTLLRSLVELDEAINLLSFQSTQQQDMLGQALKCATEALEAFCRRKLALTTFDKTYRPGRTRRVYLDTWPIAGAPYLTWGLDYAGTITNASTANQLATVTMTPVSATQKSMAGIALNATSNGVVAAPIVLATSVYPTIGSLLAAISGSGNGWQGSAPNDQYSDWPTTRINYVAGQLGAVGQNVELQIYNTDLWRYNVDTERGTIELTQNFPESYRYADRSFGIGFGWAWSGATEPRNSDVRIQFRGGYAYAAADLALGYVPVPDTLKTACLLTANAILQGGVLTGPVQSQSVTGRSYTLKGDASLVPREARVLLTKEINRRFGAWGTR